MIRVLIIQTAFLGDVVLTTPLLAVLRERYPGCQLHIVTTPAGAAILSGFSWLTTHVINKNEQSVWQSLKEIRQALKEYSFEAVYCVHRSPRSLLMGRLVSAQRRFAFGSSIARLLGYKTTPYPAYEIKMHYKDKVLALASQKRAMFQEALPFLEVEPHHESKILEMVLPLGGKPYVVISPFSAWGTKMWPWQRYQELAQKISQHWNWGVVIIGGGDSPLGLVEKEIGQKIAEAAGPLHGLNLVQETNLGEFKALVKHSRAVISNDSAPVHVAAAFRIPTLAIFGPTVEKWGFFPVSPQSLVVERNDVPCRPCSLHGPHHCPLGHFSCMKLIEPQDVVASLVTLLPK